MYSEVAPSLDKSPKEKFLNANGRGVPSQLVYFVTAFRKPALFETLTALETYITPFTREGFVVSSRAALKPPEQC